MIIYFFTANGCSVCKAMYKIWEEIIVNNTTITFQLVDCTNNLEMAKKFTVTQLPTFIMTDGNDTEVGRFFGYKNIASFQKWLDELK